ncbi:MAG: YggS family pyridoxal phosphate-dependent enzyme [Cyanobacteria bacterium P01_H01_bin.119]
MVDAADAQAIAKRIQGVRRHIPQRVRLIAVTKKFPADIIRIAYAAGIRDFGESQVQETIAKQQALTDLDDITWHLIGHLQSNKARKALEQFQWIHSVDSLKLAQRLNTLAQEMGVRPQCCLQVKVVPDPPKYGFDRSELWPALPDVAKLDCLHWAGLMSIPPLGLSAEETRFAFHQAQTLQSEINQKQLPNLKLRELSLGMSGDYQSAIAAGSTMIRLGTALFGARPAANSY